MYKVLNLYNHTAKLSVEPGLKSQSVRISGSLSRRLCCLPSIQITKNDKFSEKAQDIHLEGKEIFRAVILNSCGGEEEPGRQSGRLHNLSDNICDCVLLTKAPETFFFQFSMLLVFLQRFWCFHPTYIG